MVNVNLTNFVTVGLMTLVFIVLYRIVQSKLGFLPAVV